MADQQQPREETPQVTTGVETGPAAPASTSGEASTTAAVGATSPPAPAATTPDPAQPATTTAAAPATTASTTEVAAEVLDAEDDEGFNDADSAISAGRSDLTSLRSSVRQYQIENGRTYHGMSSGKYAYPNDEEESDRLDLQHNLWLVTLKGALCISPKERGAKRVLDVGTGTGIWAIEYADAHPEAHVVGVDLSPIQPSLVPPNCSFEVDDVEKEWTWTEPFDFIFGRVMAGSFSDYQSFFQKSFAALEPGGYIEMQDIHCPFESDDGTLTEDTFTHKLGKCFAEASEALGRPLTIAPRYKTLMEQAGFVDIVEKQYKWPIGVWPKDKHYKEVGAWYHANLDQGLEGLTMALFTRGLGWTSEEAMLFCAQARPQLKDPRIHAYLPIYVVYGKKPE